MVLIKYCERLASWLYDQRYSCHTPAAIVQCNHEDPSTCGAICGLKHHGNDFILSHYLVKQTKGKNVRVQWYMQRAVPNDLPQDGITRL